MFTQNQTREKLEIPDRVEVLRLQYSILDQVLKVSIETPNPFLYK